MNSLAGASRIVVCTLTLIVVGVTAKAALPKIPTPAEVARYTRMQPVFRSVQVAGERGDALLTALDGGRHVQKRQIPPGIVCALPIEQRHVLAITLTNGSTYQIGISFEGSTVYLPEGLSVVSEAARERIVTVIKEMEEDLQREVRAAPKPCKYRLGTADDGGTLSGVAFVAYGEARKWRHVYDANRAVIKNPNSIQGDELITLPRLDSDQARRR